ncbi:sigma-70 family RNA polymerase sigma factor [Maribellus sp. CM-23]|uniref:RNA polymerase sigma factor n=1 Tax=Maribellus sp. CM-23 TaxID=2781026 RepID=UPI001F2E4428|nr:sigma-70 family RNA polymerase sigma factor [Maribellus sp. CM-23]MCE4566637.1 sigma-70 family RNA polymerase sigma factor [Maribellus sp. CM-23]
MNALLENSDHWQSLWERFIDGDKKAFALIYEDNIDGLFQYGSKLHPDESTVKDAIQEVFYDFYIKRKSIQKSHSIKFYLLLALKRNLIRKLQAERKQQVNNEEDDFYSEPETNPEYQTIKKESEKELEEKIKNALLKLPAKQKEAVYLRFDETLPYEEIAKILNISVESARTLVYRAIKTIKKILKTQGSIVLLSFFKKKQ